MMLPRRDLLASALALLCLEGCRDDVKAKPEQPSERLALRADGTSPKKIRIGITPHAGEETAKELEPLLNYLRKQLPDTTFSADVAKGYDKLAGMLDNGEVEMGVFSPLSYVKHRKLLKAKAIELATVTKRGAPTYVGYLVIMRDEHAKDRPTLESLEGKRIAYVHKSSTSGYLYPRALLRSFGKDPDEFFAPNPVFAGDHREALHKLWRGEVDVAAVASAFADPGPLNALTSDEVDPKEVIAKLQVVAKTDRIPLDAVLLRNDIALETGMKLQRALLELHDDVSASRKLQDAWGMNGFVSPKLADGTSRYDTIASVLKESGG